MQASLHFAGSSVRACRRVAQQCRSQPVLVCKSCCLLAKQVTGQHGMGCFLFKYTQPSDSLRQLSLSELLARLQARLPPEHILKLAKPPSVFCHKRSRCPCSPFSN